jgi:putative transposase
MAPEPGSGDTSSGDGSHGLNRPNKYSPYMADTYTKILVHCVFSTKERRPQILEPEKLWSYLRGIARNRGVDTLAIGGTANHVHILLALPSSLTVAQLMRDLKANSSRHLNEQIRNLPGRMATPQSASARHK